MSIWGISIRKYNLFLMDTSVFLLSLYLALSIRRLEIISVPYFLSHIPTFFIIYLFFMAGMYVMGMYDVVQFSSSSKKIRSILYASLSSALLGNTFFYLFHSNYTPKTVLVIQLVILSALVFCIRFIYENQNKNKLKVAIIGDSKYKTEIENTIEKNHSLEILKNIQNIINDFDRYSDKNVIDMIRSSGVDILVLDLKDTKISKLLPSIYDISKTGIKVMDIANFYEFMFKKAMLDHVSFNWFFKEVKVDTRIYEFVKRIIDTILCVPVFIFWLFIHPWVYFNIKNEDGGEVYSIQERIGRHNKKIFIKKYRTMLYTDKGAWLEKSENKVTDFGKFLRRTRIDELPQIFSVLKGDLSFIGPRTDIVNLGDKLADEVDNYNLRYSVTPGLSGWAQVNMDYQPRTVEDSMERLRYDLYYVKNRSFILDFIIILKTIKTVLSREGS